MAIRSLIIPIQNMHCKSCSSKIQSLFNKDMSIYSIKSNLYLKQIKIEYEDELTNENEIKLKLTNNGYEIEEKIDYKYNLLFLSLFNYILIHYSYEIFWSVFIYVILQLYLFLFITRSKTQIKHLVFLSSKISYAFGVFMLLFDLNESFIYLKISNILCSFILAGQFVEDAIKKRNLKFFNEKKDILYVNTVKYQKINDKDINMQTKNDKFPDIIKNISEDENIICENKKYNDLILYGETKNVYEQSAYSSFISTDQININDIIIIKKNNIIPVDGILLTNNTYVNESSLTGEAEPIFKEKENMLYAGTINLSNEVIMKVTKIKKETLQGQILDIIENSYFLENDKKIFYFSKFMSYYSLVILIVYYILYFQDVKPLILYKETNFHFLVPIKILVTIFIISCPCALSLSEPMLLITASNKMLTNGIILNNLAVLKKEVDCVVFDKTGTLTDNFEVDTFVFLGNNFTLYNDTINIPDVFYFLFYIERDIDHPIAKAILYECKNKIENYTCNYKIIKKTVEYIQTKGIKGTMFIQIKSHVKELQFKILKEHMNHTFYLNEILIATFKVEEKIKENALEIISNILDNKKDVILLSGDNELSVQTIANKLGIYKYFFKQTSKDKFDFVNELIKNKKNVMMVGDGINDLTAIKKSTVGISLDNLTSKSDIIVINNHLQNIEFILNYSKRIQKHLLFCYGISFIYNVIMIMLASGFFIRYDIYVNPDMSCLFMFLSSVFVFVSTLCI